MAKKRSIHELIEEQEPEAKQRMWEEVRQRIAQEDILDGKKTPRKKFSWKKFAVIAASFVLVLGISLFSVFHFMPQEELKSRYCTQEEYSSRPIEIINGETGDIIKLFITDNYTDIDILQNFKEISVKQIKIKNIQINYGNSFTNAYAYFEFNKNRYYIDLFEPMTETAILDIVEELLP